MLVSAERYGAPVQTQDAPAPAQSSATGARPRWLEAVAAPLGLLGAAVVAHIMVAWEQERVLRNTTVRGVLSRWDAGLYLRISLEGYPTHLAPAGYGPRAQNALGFYPFFPLIVRGAWKATGTHQGLTQTGILVAILAAAGAVLVLWQLTARLCGPEVAHRSVALFVFAPGAIVLSMPYSEGLFVVFAATALLFLIDKRWELAGAAAFFACVTRPNGIAVVAACGVAALQAWWPHRRELTLRNLRPFLAPMIGGLGFATFPLYLWVHAGDPLAYWKTQHRGWKQGFDLGRNALDKVWGVVLDPLHDFNLLMATLAIIAIAIGFVLMARWRPPASIVTYTAVIVFMALTSSELVSTWRFAMTAFPLCIAYARATRGTVFAVVLATSAVLFTVAAFGATTLLYTP